MDYVVRYHKILTFVVGIARNAPMQRTVSLLRWLGAASSAAILTIASGFAFAADIPRDNSSAIAAAESRFHDGQWPFCSPTRPPLPDTGDHAGSSNPIDHFIAARRRAAGVHPNPPADKATLLRRVTYDLTGLPPTPAELESFLTDDSTDAYLKVVDRLLASPRFGERWAQHWLDLVRYAESDGFKADQHRPNAYRYRDYVIDSFNSDRPFDEFIRQQLAGDELEPENPDALVATGFLRLYADEDNAANLFQRRQEILDDVTGTTGLVFLGLTMGCAQCHDHKFDDILQTDFYQLQAFFVSMVQRDHVPLAERSEVLAHQEQLARWEQATAQIRSEIDRIVQPARDNLEKFSLEKYEPAIVACYSKPADERSPFEEEIARMVNWRLERTISDEAIRNKLSPEDREKLARLQKRLAKFDVLKPKPLPTAMTVSDLGVEAPPTHLLEGGSWKRPEALVEPGFPEFLGATTPQKTALAYIHRKAPTTGRRTQLAYWLTRRDHPLTARVIVNRLWQHHFGRGIVESPNDFGSQGDPPTHPELLDWLAVELVDHGWSLKHIHRLMVTSSTYQLSSLVDASDAGAIAAAKLDADNKLWWRANRQRLEGEEIRDAMLQVAGDLNFKMHGPSTRPKLPDGVSARYAWKPNKDPVERNRRSIYVLAKRNMRFPLFEAFDQPDMHQSCPRRAVTVTAPQSLAMLNSQLTLELAHRWAERLVAEHGHDPDELVRAAYRAAYSRTAANEEIDLAKAFLADDAALAAENPDATSSPEHSPAAADESHDGLNVDAVAEFCHALFNSNEFITVD
jgi:hypothetical protein